MSERGNRCDFFFPTNRTDLFFFTILRTGWLNFICYLELMFRQWHIIISVFFAALTLMERISLFYASRFYERCFIGMLVKRRNYLFRFSIFVRNHSICFPAKQFSDTIFQIAVKRLFSGVETLHGRKHCR